MSTAEKPRAAPAAALVARFTAFAIEQFPEAFETLRSAFESVARSAGGGQRAEDLEALRAPLAEALRRALPARAPRSTPETTPGVDASDRLAAAAARVIDACDGFLAREAIAASLQPGEKLEILRGMLLTRAVDNRLKAFFTGGEVRWKNSSFQGKGFRSLGQEAIYAAGIRLRRGSCYGGDGPWRGDVVAPLIRDLGLALAMQPDRESVRMVLSAQMGKTGPPMNGKDLHVGDFARGILPASAPLAISSLTVAGLALAFAMDRTGQVAVSLIGEGGTSLGEWHEAINLCAARKLPAIFCVQNNQTALSTPVSDQCSARVFAEKAAGYGIPGITIDGTDAAAVAAAFSWAADRARSGRGPALIELVAMRMCGHAHHDDMLYLGKDPPPSWDYPELSEAGYADRDLYDFWARRDPIARWAEKLVAEGALAAGDLDRLREETARLVEEEARAVIDAPWPDPGAAGEGVFAGEPPRRRIEPLEERAARSEAIPEVLPVEPGLPFDPKGKTFLEAVMLGVGDALRADPRAFVIGEDVGGKYGNAFLLLRPLLAEFGDRILNSPLAEGAVIAACVGSALAGKRPIGEMQFNDFVATGFDGLVNNAAKIRYRWGGEVPMVLRMPWGGLRHAGPYHSQNTEPWFYRTPGLKIVVPSTPEDARALMAAAVADPDPVLYYEHIALYRDPRVKQAIPDAAPAPLPLGKAAVRRPGKDVAIVSYGAYVHAARRVAETLSADGIDCAVLDLRTLVPLDRRALLAVARRCGRVLIVHEDSRTGGIGESLAAIIQEEAFEWLDAPIRILGALDTPVPYSPPLEEFFLPSEAEIEKAARLLARY
ncbi:MAG TPA: thiamine pyrophosphate-dependent enzyme [Thermoanaerobaculia bacterium]|nr:thiamine pyrophosphate-dependent enzyme [Thermoanaerobaculia bacterium]